MHAVEKNLARISALNPHLADELSRLPELRAKAKGANSAALDNLLAIYRFSPDRFDHMFHCMNRIGLPDARKYCSPLQALFWMLQDEKFSRAGDLLGLDVVGSEDNSGACRPELCTIRNARAAPDGTAGTGPEITLETILNASWNGEYRSLDTPRIHRIIQRIIPGDEAEEYALLITKHSPHKLQGYIMQDFLKKKEIFDTGDWQAIERAIELSRWLTFYTVADRLNAPELISYYINRYLYFRKTPANGVYFTFYEKHAQCTDAAYFTQFMLARSGYTTFIRSVKWDHDPWDGLHTGAGIVLDDGRYLLVSNYTGINKISGPFPDIESLDKKMSCGRKIIASRWGAYYPPRYY